MPEKLLSVDEAAARLGIRRRKFYRMRQTLVAQGLQERTIGQQRRYRDASIERMIEADDEATKVIA